MAVAGRADKAVRAVIAGQRRAAERRWGRGTGRLADTVAVSVGTLQGGGQVNLIPAAAMAEVDVRVPPGLTTAAIEREARRRIERVTRGTVEVEVFNQCDPYVTPPDSRLVRLVLANAQGDHSPDRSARREARLHRRPILSAGRHPHRGLRAGGVQHGRPR